MWIEVILGSLTLGGTLATGFFAVIRILLKQNSEQMDRFIDESAANRQVIVDNTQAFTAMKEYIQSGSVGKIKKKREDL